MQKIALTALAVFGLSSVAIAQTNPPSFYNAPTGWAAASNSLSNTAYNPVWDSGTSMAANYIISELGNNDSFNAPNHMTQGNMQTWTETTPSGWATASILYSSGSPGNYFEQFAEDGSKLMATCSSNPSTNPEYDYFLGPNNSDMTSPWSNSVVTAISSPYTSGTFPLLGALTSLTVTGQMVVNSVSQPVSPTPCNINHISLGYSFNLSESVTKVPQNFAYTLHLGHFCLAGQDQQNCLTAPQNTAVWYKVQGVAPAVTDTPSGFSVSTLSFVPAGGSPGSGPLNGTGTITFNKTDLLTRLYSIITNNPENLDPNPADWRITALGYGNSMWGDSASSVSYGGLNVAVVCKNTPC